MSKACPKKDTTYTKLFVGNIPYGTNDETLRTYFAQFGLIEEAVVIRSKNDNASKGYGFVSANIYSFTNICLWERSIHLNMKLWF